MVKYWKTQDSVEAKVVRAPEGHHVMYMKGEKYPFPGYPRGSLLYGKLSPLKHWIKNKVFNEVWKMLEERKPLKERMQYLRGEAYPYIFDLGEGLKYDMVPHEQMVPPVKELYRAFTKVAKTETDLKWRDIVTFIFQEDDAYRMRFQWLVKFFPRFSKPTLKDFDKALGMLEHGETVGDMKERVRLLRRVLNALWEDAETKDTYERLLKEIDWKKLELTKGDKYFFRAKYFKVDYPEYAY